MDEIRLVKQAKKGNKEALLQLIMKQKNDYYKLAFTYMGNKNDALDAMEDMIVKLYEKIHHLKKEEAFYQWSKTILVNCCKSLLRKRKKVVLVEDWQEGNDSVIDPYEVREQQLDIQQLLRTLNQHQAEAIRLKYFHDLDYQSISELTNVSVGTVKSRVFQGLKKLKGQIGGSRNE